MATLLTADTVTTYVLKNLDKLPTGFFGEEALTSLTASAIQGGNVNYAFVVSSGDKKVFVKQAPEFVAIFGPDGFPLTSERMQKEMNVYKEWKDMLKDDQGYLPEIYFFDKSHMVRIFDDWIHSLQIIFAVCWCLTYCWHYWEVLHFPSVFVSKIKNCYWHLNFFCSLTCGH